MSDFIFYLMETNTIHRLRNGSASFRRYMWVGGKFSCEMIVVLRLEVVLGAVHIIRINIVYKDY